MCATTAIVLALGFALSSTRDVAAQILPPRQSYLFNVYVDPIKGDDGRAFAFNPGVSGNPAPLSQHPSASQNGIGGVLQHAPFAFRTLTGTQGVRVYLDALGAQYGAGGRLPWAMANNLFVNWVVIHCQPGIYAPSLAGDSSPVPIDRDNGLPYNSETWPFVLYDRESLQGASALDTIFDARQRATSIVRVESINYSTQTHRQSFILGERPRPASQERVKTGQWRE